MHVSLLSAMAQFASLPVLAVHVTPLSVESSLQSLHVDAFSQALHPLSLQSKPVQSGGVLAVFTSLPLPQAMHFPSEILNKQSLTAGIAVHLLPAPR